MNGKKSFNKRDRHEERRSNRNVFKDVEEFTSGCNIVGRNENLDEGEKIRENIGDVFSYRGLTSGQFRLSDISVGATSNFIEDRSFNINSKIFSDSRSNNEPKLDNDKFSNTEKLLSSEKLDSVSPTLISSRKVRHLPFRTLSHERIASISRKIGKIKAEVLHPSFVSKNEVASKSEMSSKKTASNCTKSKPSPIILPKEQFHVLQERIKSEIENLKLLESSGSSEKSGEENKTETKEIMDEDEEFDNLGSDIQYLPKEEREKLFQKYLKKTCDDKEESKSEEINPISNLSEECAKSDLGIITIDLTKESTPFKEIEKTDFKANDYPSLDLDYGSKIDWDDKEKPIDNKNHSILVTEKPIVKLDIDESKLTVETTKKITDIKNRLARSLSIGLSHKETEKDTISEDKSSINILNIPGEKEQSSLLNEGESSIEDAETLELASLRCTSERTEVIADRERRRKRRCADYPGLAFGFSIFSSDTMMKFNIIRNELHNIMNTQLKRVCTN